MKRYARKVICDVALIEKKMYDVNGYNIKFTCELIPSDMKWLASFSGELNNASYYFSSFGNVNTDNMSVINGSLGAGSDCTWKPWQYAERIKASTKVSDKKIELSKHRGNKPPYAISTQRSKLLEFIREQGHRQEFPPILGPLIDVAYSEPLHNSNNSWQFIHSHICDLAIQKSVIDPGCTDYKTLPSSTPFKVVESASVKKSHHLRLLRKFHDI